MKGTVKTKLDLYLSAHDAAKASLDEKEQLTVDQAAIAKFNEAGGNPVDWSYWKQQFTEVRARMKSLSAVAAPSQPPQVAKSGGIRFPRPPGGAVALLVGGLLLAATLAAKAGTTILIGTLPTVDTNAVSGSNVVTTIYPPSYKFTISNTGLDSTNELWMDVQFSLDGTNYVNAATYHPVITAATNEYWSPTWTNPTLYMRVSVTTTSAIPVGVTYATPGG